MAETAPGTTAISSIFRDKKTQDITVTIGELPKELAKTNRRGGESCKGEQKTNSMNDSSREGGVEPADLIVMGATI